MKLSAMLLAVAATTAIAGESASGERCSARRATCAEGCTLDYGTSERTREQVPKCIALCSQAEVVCLARGVARKYALDAKAARERTVSAPKPPAPLMDRDLPPVRARVTPTPKTPARPVAPAPAK